MRISHWKHQKLKGKKKRKTQERYWEVIFDDEGKDSQDNHVTETQDRFQRQNNTIRFAMRPNTMGKAGIRNKVNEALTMGKKS